jgi:membrane protease YdiL (CAAX protease family)
VPITPSAITAALPTLVDLTPDDTIPAVDAALPWWPVAAVIVMIVMVNVAAHKALKDLYLFWALGGSVVVLTIGLLDGTTWSDLGLAPNTWVSGLVWGIGSIVAIYTVYEVGSRLPRIRRAFGDQNIAGMPKWRVYWEALVRLPFGTVLFEEIAFRGVLWAMLARRMDWVHATWITAVLFGLWHILGSLDLHERNPGLAVSGKPRMAQFLAVSGAVVNTALGGLLFTGLRVVSGSLLAPMGFHWATNGWGYLFARRIHVNGDR